jgi:hypothetical protein
MTPHCKIYFKHFHLTIADFVPCEVCKSKAVDIHHIHGRGKGKDVIENLMALCREHHNQAHGEILKKDQLQNIHNIYLKHAV